MLFVSQDTRKRWLEHRRKFKGTAVYMRENVTRHCRTLLAATKGWAKRECYMYALGVNGKTLLRKKEGERAVVMKSEDDLDALDEQCSDKANAALETFCSPLLSMDVSAYLLSGKLITCVKGGYADSFKLLHLNVRSAINEAAKLESIFVQFSVSFDITVLR